MFLVARMETIKEKGSNDDENDNIPGVDTQGIQVDIVDLLEIQLLELMQNEGGGGEGHEEEEEESLKEKLRATQELIGRYKGT